MLSLKGDLDKTKEMPKSFERSLDENAARENKERNGQGTR